MKGTFAYCHTREAFKRMEHGDILQRLADEKYYRKEKGGISKSDDTYYWIPSEQPPESFPTFEEWRSLSNLHYYEDLKKNYPNEVLLYLSHNDKVLEEDHPKSDKEMKRWFLKSLWS